MSFKPVKQISIRNSMSVNELVKEMSACGVLGAGRLARAVDLAEAMIRDKGCKVFLGLAGPLIPAGLRGIIIDMLSQRWIDVLVTTGATLTHDLVEALGFDHYQGSSKADDAKLRQQGLDRIYDIYMPNEVYGKLEDFFNDFFSELQKEQEEQEKAEPLSIRQFLQKLGKSLNKQAKSSILRTCYEKNIPLFCPALADSGIGLMVWGWLARRKKLSIDAFDDLKEIIAIAWDCTRAGIIYIGGGVPKNFIQQAMQLTKAASYGVQITTAFPEFGGSSGAELREGISWGKMHEKGKFVDVYCDASIALPILHAALKERLSKQQ